jgi:hypothetical protein
MILVSTIRAQTPATGSTGLIGSTGQSGSAGQIGPSGSSATPPYSQPPDYVFLLIYAPVIAILVGGFIYVGKTLGKDRDWNFADAMSGADGKPSSSRLIAFIGMLVMVTVILGFGYSTLWVFLATGTVPVLSGATAFLVACAGLFTPYLASQIGTAIGSSQPTSLAPVVVQSATPTPNPANAQGPQAPPVVNPPAPPLPNAPVQPAPLVQP